MTFVNDEVARRTYDPERGLELKFTGSRREEPDAFMLKSEAGGSVAFRAWFDANSETHLTWTVAWVGEVHSPFPQAASGEKVRELIVEAMSAYGFRHRVPPECRVSVDFDVTPEAPLRAKRALSAALGATAVLAAATVACLLLPMGNGLRLGVAIGAAVALGGILKAARPTVDGLSRRSRRPW